MSPMKLIRVDTDGEYCMLEVAKEELTFPCSELSGLISQSRALKYDLMVGSRQGLTRDGF